MNIKSNLQELHAISEKITLDKTNEDFILNGIIHFDEPLTFQEETIVNSIFNKLSFIKQEIMMGNIKKNSDEPTLLFKELFDIKWPFFPQAVKFILTDYIESFPNKFEAKNGCISIQISNTSFSFSLSNSYYRPIFFLMRHIFTENENFLAQLECKDDDVNPIQHRDNYHFYMNFINSTFVINKFSYAHSQSTVINNTHLHINDVVKLPESFLQDMTITKFHQGNNPSDVLDNLRILFSPNNIKTHHIKNYAQVASYIEGFELVHNFALNEKLEASILHNIMLKCKLFQNEEEKLLRVKQKL